MEKESKGASVCATAAPQRVRLPAVPLLSPRQTAEVAHAPRAPCLLGAFTTTPQFYSFELFCKVSLISSHQDKS